jgi:hypothetical protein
MYTVKKRLAIFPSPTGISLTKLSLAAEMFIWSVKSRVGTGKSLIFFLQCTLFRLCCPSNLPQIKLTVRSTLFLTFELAGPDVAAIMAVWRAFQI